ncbi:S-methyl-5-thioribose-1-phosphate isomerase [Woeseia oceani]|uniref:Methylthioribose-1-phosphate isomerase n=1 Tax=Woeseia oceani TaxID=1548547 RepID=A0A193LK62_9GAMM|nr:S-methyl-5-thioribose-1-phosphate isomerase [Woeseia oceani]ANO52945.1 S-methyl-5-thioribose-1-phosphate isomerase [Woeseia oceani]
MVDHLPGHKGRYILLNRGENFRTIWLHPDDDQTVQIIDQRRLPHEYTVSDLRSYRDGITAIAEMLVRGAPLIGATAAWSLYLAALEARGQRDAAAFIQTAADELAASRPTAVNLRWALDRVMHRLHTAGPDADRVALTRAEAEAICDEDVEISLGIGRHGRALIEEISKRKNGATVNVLTHCNAGSLATINWGTATAPIYLAQQAGIDVHVWVDETRPRNQGSQLTAWELAESGVPHTLIVDNAGGHLMQHGMVDICITGTDRTTRSGDVANKIGTYLKALAAADNNVPFYVALPSTTIDWDISDGVKDIPIEERDSREVSHIWGRSGSELLEVVTVGERTPISNFAFDVTPARLITGLITEHGVCAATEQGLSSLFPEQAKRA